MKLITAVLIASLIAQPLRSQESPPPEPNAIPLIVGVVLLGLAAVSYVGVNNLIDRAFPTPYPNYTPPPPVPLPPPWKPRPSPYPRVREFRWVLGNDGYWHPCPAAGHTINSIITTPAVGSLSAFSITDADYFDPEGNRYNTLITFNALSSTNLVNWDRSLCMTQWVSHATIATVVYINGSLVTANQMAISELSYDMFGFDFECSLWDDPVRFFKIE